MTTESLVINFKTGTQHKDPPVCGIEVDDSEVVRRSKQQLDDDAYKGLNKCKKCFG